MDEKEKKEPWLNYLALSTVILAIFATLASFKGGGFSGLAMMSQSKAANQWSYYQAKSIKGYLYEIQKENLELELKGKAGADDAVVIPIKEKIAACGAKLEKYAAEKDEIQKKAKELEVLRDDAGVHSGVFGIAVIFLQISILLSSIAALMKKKPVWIVSMIVGAIGIFYFTNGFLLFMR